MKVAIVGSRDLDIDIEKYMKEFVKTDDITLIISGGATGIDTLAEEYAHENKIPIKIFYPDYNNYGRTAPIRRNISIVDTADIIFAFWNKQSKGTKFVIDYAKRKKKKLVEIRVNM